MPIFEILGYMVISYLLYHMFKLLQHKLLPFNMSSFSGEWAVVTGATDGIGKAYCFALANKGLNIVLVSRSMDKLNSVAAEIEEDHKVKTKTIQVDFSNDKHTYTDSLAKGLAGLKIGVLVNNVGMSTGPPATFTDTKISPKTLVNCNMVSVNVLTSLVLPQMLERKRGIVINIGSISALLPFPHYTLYAATKAYVMKLTECLASENRSSGVIFQCVNPGYVVTNMTELKRSSIIAPMPEEFVESALGRLGEGKVVTCGYWTHDLIAMVIRMLPLSMAINLTLMYGREVRT